MAAYARALDGTLSSSIAGQVPPDLPRYAFTFPPNGWREVITPAFVSLGGIVTWFFYQDTPVSFEIDEVVLYELSQPTCSAAPDVVCEVGI
jgi:hypothetical protein